MKIILELEEIRPTESIPPVAFHSISDGRIISPILNKSSIGMTPAEFSKDRKFYKVKEVIQVR